MIPFLRRPAPSALLVLLACNIDVSVTEKEVEQEDTASDSSSAPCDAVDLDGDGADSCSDCDEGDSAVHTGAAEVPCNEVDDDCDAATADSSSESCDGADNDCDGVVDNGFADSDADGTADCLDLEECDGVDNDGDGEVDESCSACTSISDGVSTWLLCEDLVDWATARDACLALGYDLVSFHDPADDTFVGAAIDALGGPNEWWAGGTDGASEDTWEWTDGTAWDLELWSSGEPNNVGDEDYLLVHIGVGGWNDARGTESHPYVCLL